jgi:hypothetical protein
MSVHVEWLDAGYTTAVVVGPGEEMPDGQRVDAPRALTLAADELVVIEGSAEQLGDLLRRALRQLDG